MKVRNEKGNLQRHNYLLKFVRKREVKFNADVAESPFTAEVISSYKVFKRLVSCAKYTGIAISVFNRSSSRCW